MPPATAFDVRKFIDVQSVGRYHFMVVELFLLIVLFELLYAQSIG